MGLEVRPRAVPEQPAAQLFAGEERPGCLGRLRELLGELTPKQRRVVVMRLGREFSLALCAEFLGVSRPSACRLFGRAVRRLERKLGRRLELERGRRRAGG